MNEADKDIIHRNLTMFFRHHSPEENILVCMNTHAVEDGSGLVWSEELEKPSSHDFENVCTLDM